MWETKPCLCKTELVWDGNRRATGNLHGQPLPIGEGDCRAEHFLSLAADASLMLTFLGMAERAAVRLLGYVSSARIAPGANGNLQLVLAPVLVVERESDVAGSRRLLEEALAASPVCRLLGPAIRLEFDVFEAAATRQE
jgi:hypothetical protein